jgi:Rps23 Pro-64 3,4-dihydroxylase Tpa1-like proline 4-hydroxylase
MLHPQTISFDELIRLGESLRPTYLAAAPFPHVVIDDFLPPALLDQVVAEFPGPDAVDWKRFKDGTGRKLATRDESQFGPTTLALIHHLNSSRFIRFLEALTGIDCLVPDPHLEGGGLHQIERGGFLKVHADFNLHKKLKLDRRLNVLLYLNKDWADEYGGNLELWTQEMDRCVKKISPIFNRCVVFNTTDFSFHGHPEPLTCPEGRARRSIALYYYSNGRPAEELSRSHSTLYKRRPGEKLYSPKASAKDFIHRLLSKRKT